MKRFALKRISMTLLMALLLVSGLSRIVSAGLESLPMEKDGEVTDERALLCPPSDEVSTLLARIAGRDAELSARETNIALREQDVIVARQEIEGALTRLGEAEESLAARMQQSSTAADIDIDRLVSVYEGMKPKDAAILFEAMDAGFAAGFLARMRPDAASALFSNLSPEKAYALSVIMAGRNANAARE